MADIELVIKIPEELYKSYKGRPPMLGDAGMDMIAQAIANGTQLPKGHWIYDYKSADGHSVYHCSKCGCYLKPKHSEPLSSFKWCSLCGADMREDDAPTIIEADKEN